ncbi:MAG: hypothetical protein HC854_17915, partial [Flavobacterium sp.]|nr:hypothetical protein [Flavobacterium sp.]
DYKKIIGYNKVNSKYKRGIIEFIKPFSDSLNTIWENCNETDKELLTSLLVYRYLGYTKVKLPRNNEEYWEAIKKAKELANPLMTLIILIFYTLF